MSLFVDEDCVELLACVVSCMKKSSLKTLCLKEMEGVPQCCEVFDCLRSSKIEELQFGLNESTSLPVSVMTIHFKALLFHELVKVIIYGYPIIGPNNIT